MLLEALTIVTGAFVIRAFVTGTFGTGAFGTGAFNTLVTATVFLFINHGSVALALDELFRFEIGFNEGFDKLLGHAAGERHLDNLILAAVFIILHGVG